MKKNYPIYIAIGALILINAIFLWNEPFYYFCKEPFYKSLPFDATKFSTVVSIVGVILNSLTIYLLYVQIGEMIEGRISQRRPELFPEGIFLTTRDEINQNFLSGNNLPIPSFHQFEANNWIQDNIITITNAGVGPAINLTIEWVFDENEVINVIRETYDSNQIVEKITNISFLNQERVIRARIPYLYLMLYGRRLNITMFDRVHGNQEIVKPSLQLRLTYWGTFGEQYTKLFNVNFDAHEGEIDITFVQV